MEDRRHDVMEVAQRLFLEKGFSQTSVQDIIEQANISKGTFYNYFSSKNDCLIAILKYAQKEAFARRAQLYENASQDSKALFANQIVIRMQVNKEQNLLPLLGFVFHSKDQELRQFAKAYHLHEIAWLSRRIIDLYGENVRLYAVDCAVFILGLTQQYNLVWSFYVTEEINTKALIEFVLEKIDPYIEHLVRSKNSFVHTELYERVFQVWQTYDEPKVELTTLLQRFYESYKDDPKVAQFVEFLQEEKMRKKPRTYIIKTILGSIEKCYKNDPLYQSIKKEIQQRFLI